MSLSHEPGATEIYELWPEGPSSNPAAGRTEVVFDSPAPGPAERWIRNVQVPTLTRFPAKHPKGITILVVPGGGFQFVSIDNEGYRVARLLAGQGVDAYVLTYRCNPIPEADAEIPAFFKRAFGNAPQAKPGETAPPPFDPDREPGRLCAEEDGRQAMRYLKAHAADLGIDPAKLGVIGFSAGGGIAAHLAFSAPEDCVPAFAGLIYAAYRPTDLPKAGGPAAFLAIASDDPLVPAFSTVRLAETCHRAGLTTSLHVYADGAHGFGAKTQGKQSDRWFDDFMAFVDHLHDA